MAVTAEIVELARHRKGQVCGEKPNVAPRRKYLSPDEVRRVIEAAGRIGRNRHRDQLLLTMMFRHGLRVGEAIDLRWTDFDLEAPRDRPFWVRRLKGSKDTTHTLEPDTVRLLVGAKNRAEGIYVFCSERGGPMSTDIVRVRPHMFRHAAGFTLAEAGTDTRLIQDFLGHRDIKSTVIYTETSQRRLAGVRVR